jgi:hypothetical protein
MKASIKENFFMVWSVYNTESGNSFRTSFGFPIVKGPLAAVPFYHLPEK